MNITDIIGYSMIGIATLAICFLAVKIAFVAKNMNKTN